MNNVGECISLFIPPEKSGEFWDIITSAGFEKNASGVLAYILDVEWEEDEKPEIPTASNVALGAFQEWTEKNPDEWNRAKKKGSTVMQNLFSKISKKL